MARDSLLTQALNSLSNGEFTNPAPAISVPQAAPLQPAPIKDLQVANATQRITNDFAAKGQFPSLQGEIARFDAMAKGREQIQSAMAEDLNKFAPTTELESGDPIIRMGANISNSVAGFGSSLARIALQLANKGNLDNANTALEGTTDAERLAFNREKPARDARVQANALMASDILSGRPGASQAAIEAAKNLPRQQQPYPGDAQLLDRPADEFSNTELYIPQYPGMPVRQRGGENVRQRLQRAQNALDTAESSLGNQQQGLDNEWGTDAWVNREPSQRMTQQLEQENKDLSVPEAIFNTLGAYLENPGLVVQSAAESLPYALGPIGIGAGTFGQAVQNQVDGYNGQADGQLPTNEQVADVTAWNAAHSGLNFVENLVNARALAGLSNAAITAPLRRGGEALADSAIGRAATNAVAGTSVSRLANAAGRVLGAEPVRELATTMAVNGLTEAAQNQIETRNLLGDNRWDTEGNINAGVLGALSAGVMTGPSTIGAGVGRGIETARTVARERAEAANPQAAEARRAAQEAAKPYEDLTNPEHADYNPQAAIRQQLNIVADANATPEVKAEAVSRATAVRDNAESELASVRQEIAQIQQDNAMRSALTEKLAELDQYEDSPQKQAIVDQFTQRIAEIDSRTYNEEQQNSLVERYQAATENADRIRTAYDQFETAAGIREKVSPTEVDQQVETATNPDATPEQVNSAADHVVTHPMQYTPEQLRTLADDTTNRFSETQRAAIRALADARVAQNNLKSDLTVNEDIMRGGKGYRSLGDYTSQYADAVRSGNLTLADNLRDSLARFEQSHTQKAELAQQMLDNQQYGQIVRQGDQWVINTGKKLTGKAKSQNGALDIHAKSGGLVSRIRDEANAIQATARALDAMSTARPAANANAPQPSSPAPANDATTTVEAQPQPAVVESEATEQPKQKNIKRPNRRTSDDLKTRTAKQQERVAPAEVQTQQEQPNAQATSDTDPALVSTSVTDSNVVSDATVAVKSNQNTKAEGSVSVLRPEGKSLETARTEERAKPFEQQNLVLTGFVQKVREGFVNPLVTVPNFMSGVISKADWNGRFTEVNRYLAKPMDAAQKAFIGMYTQFHSKVAADIDAAILIKQGKTKTGNDLANYRYQDFVQYLLNEDGQLDENTKTAMTASMFSWLAENGNNLIATREDLAGLFHMDASEVSTDLVNRFSEIGSSQRAVAQSLGNRAYQMLGFQVLPDVDPNRAGRMQQALGMYALHTMMKRGYLEQTTMSAREYADVITTGLDTEAAIAKRAEFSREFLNGQPIEKSRVTFNFVRVPRKEVEGKLVPADTINRIVEASKGPIDPNTGKRQGTKAIMSKLFSFDSDKVAPLTSKPGKFIQRTVGDFNQQVPSELAERLTKAQQQPYRINESVVSTMTKIAGVDEAALHHMMGVRTAFETPFMHERDRIGQEAKNADVLRALENADEVITGLSRDDSGQLQAVYMPLAVWSNNRVGVASNLLNPQGNKIHRIMVGMEAHQTDIPLNQAPVDEAGQVTEYGQFLLTVAQGMEEAPITNNGSKMPTVDKVTGATYLKGMQDYLNTPRVREAIQAMSRLINEDANANDIATVKEMVAEFGMGPHSFQSLHALALESMAREAGADNVRVAIGGESDGVTNGPILTNVLYGTADYDLLARGGLYTADAGVTNVPQYREKGGQDYYQLLGAAQNTYWNQMYPAPAGKATTQNEAFRRAIDYLSPGFGSRSKAKVQATPFNYGSGFDSLKRASARDTIDSIYKHISDIAVAYSQDKETGDMMRNRLDKAIQIVLNQGQSLGIKVPAFKGIGKTESLLSYELPRDVTAAIMQVDMATRGEASEAAIKEVAAQYIATRDTNTAITNAAFEVNKVLSDRLEANALDQAVRDGQVGSVKGVAVEGLPTNVKAKLNEQIREASAIVTSATGSLSSNKLESGYVAAKTSTSFDSNNLTTEVKGFFANAADPVDTGLSQTKNNKFTSYTSGAQVKTKTAPGVSTSALIVQGTDAAISTRVIAERPSQNFHDANLFGIKDMVEGARSQNKAMWDTVTGYDSQLANTEAMIRSFKGISDNAASLNFTASDWTNVAASLRQLAFKAGVNENFKDPVVPSVVLGRIVGDAYNREIAKLETLKGIEYVNQYGYEGGEYRVTDADRKALDTKISSLRTQREKAVTEAETLGNSLASQLTAGTTKQARANEKLDAAQRRQAVEEAASDSEPVIITPQQKNALERFLSGHKDGVVKAKDLMEFTVKALASGKTDGSKLQTRMRTSYAALAKVLANTLPDNLTVNIISGTTNPKGVKGAEQNMNARAWFYSDKNTNQINIKMDGPEAPGLEVVLHEMLHAATARALDAARRDPKANPALTQIVERLESLRQEVAQSVQSMPQFAPAVRNVDELVSWGMTNPAFQQHLDGLQSSMYPRQRQGVRQRLGSLFKEFANTVLRAVYAFTGRKPTAEVMTATEALILDTAELIQTANTQGGDTALNLPMASAAQSAQAVGQYTHREVFDSLAASQGGKKNDPNFTRNLGKVIDNVSDKLFSQIGGDHLTTGTKNYTPGQVWANALATGKAPYTTKALSAGFRMTDQEAFAIESIETAVAASLNSGFGSAVNRELRKSWEAAREKIQPKDFHNGDWAKATPAERNAAQKKWDHLFTLTPSQNGQNRYLSQFVAMTLGHEETSKLMGFTTRDTESTTPKTNFEKAAAYLSHAVNWASGLLSRTSEGQLVNQKAQVLAEQLIQIDLKNRDKSMGKIEEAFTYVSDLGEAAGRKLMDGVHATADTDLIKNSRSPIIRFAGSVTRIAAKRNLDRVGETVRQLRDLNNPNTEDGWAAQILSDMTNPDKVRSAFESLQRHTNLIEQRRRNLAEVTRGNVMEMFQDSGKYLTEDDKTALTYTLMRTEAHSLLNSYTMDDVQKFVTDGRTRKAEINKLEKSILTQPHGNDMVIRAKALGYYMVTGKATIPGMAKNAQAIASGAGTNYVTTTLPDRSGAVVESIDNLASLYAMQYSNPEHLKRTADVMKRELPNQDNGIKAMLNVHKVLSEDAASTLFADNEISRIKGYIPEVTNPYRDVKIVDKGEGAELEAMGYQFVGIVPTDPTIPSLGQKAMYVTQDNGSQRYVSGAMSLTSNHRKGSKAVRNQNYQQGEGATVADGRKAVYAAVQRRAKMDASMFDPSQVKDTYMIPVFGTDGRIMDFQYEMQHVNRDTLLDRNNDFAHLLGQYAGQSFDKQHSPTQNRVVMEALYEDFKSNYASAPERYVVIGPMAKDARAREIWAMLPEQTRYDAQEIWGAGEPLQVRSDLVNLVFGFRKLTVGNAFEKDAMDRNMVESLATSVFSAISGKDAKRVAVQTERAAQEGMALFKDIIVLRNVSTLMRNLIGNVALLKAYGVSPTDIVRDTKTALQAGLSYRKNTALLLKYQQQQRAGLGDFNQLEQRIIQLEDQLARNPIKDFIEAGTMPSIVDDVDTSDTSYTYASGLQRKVSGVTDKIPASVRTAAKWAFVAKDTPLYKFLSNTAQFGDFTSKYVLYKYSMEKADRKLSHEEAIQRASDAFVNYDIPTSAELQYLNDIGGVMFTKYRLRIQRAMLTLMKERPGSAIAQSVLVSRFTDAPSALEPNLFTGFGNPFSTGVLQLPDAATQPLPIKLMSNMF